MKFEEINRAIGGQSRESADVESIEAEKEMSESHGLSVFVRDGEVQAKQINNDIFLSKKQKALFSRIARESGAVSFNIPLSAMTKFTHGSLDSSDVLPNPVPVILLSSKGLVSKAEWTTGQPSEGVWVLAEWLSRHSPSASPLCIDPNMLSDERLEQILHLYTSGSSNSLPLIAFSPLPANLENDVAFISKVRSIIPESVVVAGGIGSESLAFLPTTNGEKGITHVTDIDLVVPGTGVAEITNLVDSIYSGEIIDKKSLNTVYQRMLAEQPALDHDAFAQLWEEIQRSRETVRQHFIPVDDPDIVHQVGYEDFNKVKGENMSTRVVSVLTDNRCNQGCYFCSSSKHKVFETVDAAVKHILQKSKGSDVIAFNNNDLGNNTEETIALCKGMVAKGITQPKHGKIRADKYKPELLDALAEAGFVRLAVGVESFSADVRSAIGKKNFSDEAIKDSLDHMLRVGIRPEINLLPFSPQETDETLKQTVEEALSWVDKGASLLTTLGLFAVPNSPAVLSALREDHELKKIHFKKIQVEGKEGALLFPTQWKTSEDMEKLKTYVIERRREIVGKLSEKFDAKLSVPSDAYVTIALLANHYHLEGFETEDAMQKKIEAYIQQELHNSYVHI